MVDYEQEYLCWESRQLVLRTKYKDTPLGLNAGQAGEEENRLLQLREEYYERKQCRLTTGIQLSEEPFAGCAKERGFYAGHAWDRPRGVICGWEFSFLPF